MQRRGFISGFSGLIATWPLAAFAQQPRRGQRVPHVGILNYAAADDSLVHEFRNGLRELGRVEGPALSVTYRWADGRLDLLPRLAAELIASNVDVIIALGCAFRRSRPGIPGEAGRLYRLKPAGHSDDAGHLGRRFLVSAWSSGQLALSSSSF
jgi:hypothetical protein